MSTGAMPPAATWINIPAFVIILPCSSNCASHTEAPFEYARAGSGHGEGNSQNSCQDAIRKPWPLAGQEASDPDFLRVLRASVVNSSFHTRRTSPRQGGRAELRIKLRPISGQGLRAPRSSTNLYQYYRVCRKPGNLADNSPVLRNAELRWPDVGEEIRELSSLYSLPDATHGVKVIRQVVDGV